MCDLFISLLETPFLLIFKHIFNFSLCHRWSKSEDILFTNSNIRIIFNFPWSGCTWH